MKIFSLATIDDFKVFIFTIFFVMAPIFLVLLIPYFLYTAIVIDMISNTFHFINGIPGEFQWILFTLIPSITLTWFFFGRPKTIFIEKDCLEIEQKSGIKERIEVSDINNFIAYKTITPWTWGDLSKHVDSSSLYPITIQNKNNVKTNLLMKGEIWNNLKEIYPIVPVEQKSILNYYSLVILFITLLNLVNGIVFVFLYFGNS